MVEDAQDFICVICAICGSVLLTKPTYQDPILRENSVSSVFSVMKPFSGVSLSAANEGGYVGGTTHARAPFGQPVKRVGNVADRGG